MSTDRKKTKLPLKITAIVLAAAIIFAAGFLPAHFGGFKEAWWALNGGKISYPCVFVHGLGGWGEASPLFTTADYWGGSSGSLKEYLTSQGHEVFEPTVGPVSSNWDRACELYAQLTGTRVDYGAAHSEKHNHERYGREYTTPLIENWGKKINGGQRVKINLIGHSFGGTAARTLASLLEYGDENEKNAAQDNISPLFTGGKGDFVFSVTTLCTPHNGSSLTEVINKLGSVSGVDSTKLLSSIVFTAAGAAQPMISQFDFMLDHFNISGGSAEKTVSSFLDAGTDNAFYDLSPDGAAEINKNVKTVKGVYYFSCAYRTTKSGTLIKGEVPESSTLPVLYPLALAMGTFKGTTRGGIEIDETWQPNDGLVSVVSAVCPSGEKYANPADTTAPEKGKWYYLGEFNGDHGTVIGLNADAQATHKFYDNHLSLLKSLKR